MRRVLLSFLVLVLFTAAVAAVEPDEKLDDPGLEARARALSAGFRCLVCQNQSIDDSQAPLAHDLRVLIRQLLKAGDSDADIRTFVVARYGEFVLLKPPFEPRTIVLWLAPFALVAFGIWLVSRRTEKLADGERPMTGEEKERLQKLLKG